MTAETIATEHGHRDLLAWLVRSRHWTLLHHLEVLTPERAFDLLRAGGESVLIKMMNLVAIGDDV